MKINNNFLMKYKSPLVLMIIIILAIILSPRAFNGDIIFLNFGNLTDMLRSVSHIAIMALAMTFVIMTAGIDLSVGSVLAFSGIITASILVKWQPGISPGLHMSIAALAAVLACGFIGLIIGFLISSLRIQPFIITLAAMIGVRGMSLWLSNNERIGLGVGADVAGKFGDIFSGKIMMIGTFIVLAFIFMLILRKTVFGRYIRAIGDNAVASRYAGLPIRTILMAVYALSGLMAGIAGVLLSARTTTGDPNAGIASELDVIAVVVIGGTLLSGGKGSIIGTVNGILIIGILTNILGLNNVDFNTQLMIKALIIIIAVALQQKKKE